jgi:hypothetical protein
MTTFAHSPRLIKKAIVALEPFNPLASVNLSVQAKDAHPAVATVCGEGGWGGVGDAVDRGAGRSVLETVRVARKVG